MLVVKILLSVCLILLGSAFAALNAGTVNLNYYFGELDLPFALVAIALIAIGVVLGAVVVGFKLLRLRRDNFMLRRQVKQLSGEPMPPRTTSLGQQ
jgi:putative membrane protein